VEIEEVELGLEKKSGKLELERPFLTYKQKFWEKARENQEESQVKRTRFFVEFCTSI